MRYSEEDKLCLIIAAFNPGGISDFILHQADNAVIICADSGYIHAQNAHLQPHYIIGDFDSSPLPDSAALSKSAPSAHFSSAPASGLALSDAAPNIIRLPKEKDDTDTLACVRKGLELGMKRFLIACGTGGRPDHAFANLQVLAYLNSRGAKAILADPKTRIQIASPGRITLHRESGLHFSLFAYSEHCSGVTLSGAKYPLQNATLHNTFPIGVSNEFEQETVTVAHSEGQLLIMLTADDK